MKTRRLNRRQAPPEARPQHPGEIHEANLDAARVIDQAARAGRKKKKFSAVFD